MPCRPRSEHSHQPSRPPVSCSMTVMTSPRRKASSSGVSAMLSYRALAKNICCNTHTTTGGQGTWVARSRDKSGEEDYDGDVELQCPWMSVDILGTNCDQCVSMVQYCFTYTETIRLVRTESPGRPPTFTQLLKSEVKKTKRSLLNLGFERPVNRIGSPQDDAEEQKTTKKLGSGGRGGGGNPKFLLPRPVHLQMVTSWRRTAK